MTGSITANNRLIAACHDVVFVRADIAGPARGTVPAAGMGKINAIAGRCPA